MPYPILCVSEIMPPSTEGLQQAVTLAIAALTQLADPNGTVGRRFAKETLEQVNALLVSAPNSTPKLEQATQLPLSEAYTINTDGACKGNPGPAAWGVVVESVAGRMEAKGYLGQQTNQIAELCAAIEGLRLTPEGAVVTLRSDSQYVLKGVSEWRYGWERNNWRNSKQQPVANQSHWVQLLALVDTRQVTVQWVKGHNGDPMNERCDQLANEAIAEAS